LEEEGDMSNDKNHVPGKGEGDHEADRRYREETERFIASGRVDEAAREAQRAVAEEGEELEAAEAEGKSRVAEEDPEVKPRG
jgi:hypothetical protein